MGMFQSSEYSISESLRSKVHTVSKGQPLQHLQVSSLSTTTYPHQNQSLADCQMLLTFNHANTKQMVMSETANLAKSVRFHEVDGSDAVEMEQQLTTEEGNFCKRNDQELPERIV